MPNLQTLKVIRGGSDSALNQDYVSSNESNDSIEQVDAIEAISGKSQHPAQPPSQETTKLDSSADESNQSSKSSEGITFVEKNQSADTVKKAKETISKIWKKLPKKWLAIGAGAIIAICIISAVVSSIMSQPLNLDASVTLDDVTFDYPAEWEAIENTQDESFPGWTIRSSSALQGVAKLSQEKEYSSNFDSVITKWKSDKSYVIDSSKEQRSTLSGYSTYQAPIKMQGDSDATGYLLLIDMGSRTVSCVAYAKGGAPANYLPTLKAIIDSAHVESVNEAITVTYMDGDAIVKEETIYNKGGGATATPPADLTKEGHVLAGWQVVSEEADIDITGFGSSMKIGHITEDITLQAQWEKAWTVTFTDGAGSVLKTESVANGGSAIAPSSPSRSGYTFKGWSADFKDVTSDLTIDAQWTKIPTTSEKNALATAQSYLRTVGGFSYTGLIEQLEYEKYSHSDAVYAADNCGADWNEQAAQSARSYMKVMSFSRGGLIDQLEYEGFTYDQAVYGANAVGL